MALFLHKPSGKLINVVLFPGTNALSSVVGRTGAGEVIRCRRWELADADDLRQPFAARRLIPHSDPYAINFYK